MPVTIRRSHRERSAITVSASTPDLDASPAVSERPIARGKDKGFAGWRGLD
jgi:hypothetical protein